MSSTQRTDDADRTAAEELDVDALRTQLAVVREENERLRSEYARARQTTYRRTAAALFGVGGAAVAAGLLLTGVREILFVLGAIGIFGGILTWYLTPERVLTVGVADSVFTAHEANGTRLLSELGLQDTPVYVPGQDGVWLFVPAHREFAIPESVSGGFHVETEARGISLLPAGRVLYDDFAAAGTRADSPSRRETATRVGDALVEQFELVDAVAVDASSDDTRVVVSIEGAAFGSITDFDHPAVSVLACGLADTHEQPVAVDSIDETTAAFEFDIPPLPQ